MSMSKRKTFCRRKNTCKKKMQSKKIVNKKSKTNLHSNIPSFIGNRQTGIGKTIVTESILQSGRHVHTTIHSSILGFMCQPHFIFQRPTMYARVSDLVHDNVYIPCSIISKEKTLDWWKATGDVVAQNNLKQKWVAQGSCFQN